MKLIMASSSWAAELLRRLGLQALQLRPRGARNRAPTVQVATPIVAPARQSLRATLGSTGQSRGKSDFVGTQSSRKQPKEPGVAPATRRESTMPNLAEHVDLVRAYRAARAAYLDSARRDPTEIRRLGLELAILRCNPEQARLLREAAQIVADAERFGLPEAT